MKYTGLIKGSKSMDFQAFTLIMIAAEANLGMIEQYLGGHYGWVAFTFVIANAILRLVTTNGVGKKLFGKKDV